MVLMALEFAARRHKSQFRKGSDKTPYINHPIQVAGLLASKAGVKDPILLSAAFLHDVIEDTVETEEERYDLISQIREKFGDEILSLTLEVTDDKTLEKHDRKRLQIEHAPFISERAKKLKIADKIMNIKDINSNPPEGWSLTRIAEYHDWAEMVVAGMRGVSPELERIFDDTLRAAREKYSLQN